MREEDMWDTLAKRIWLDCSYYVICIAHWGSYESAQLFTKVSVWFLTAPKFCFRRLTTICSCVWPERVSASGRVAQMGSREVIAQTQASSYWSLLDLIIVSESLYLWTDHDLLPFLAWMNFNNQLRLAALSVFMWKIPTKINVRIWWKCRQIHTNWPRSDFALARHEK